MSLHSLKIGLQPQVNSSFKEDELILALIYSRLTGSKFTRTLTEEKVFISCGLNKEVQESDIALGNFWLEIYHRPEILGLFN